MDADLNGVTCSNVFQPEGVGLNENESKIFTDNEKVLKSEKRKSKSGKMDFSELS